MKKQYICIVGSDAQHFGIKSDIDVTLTKFASGETSVQLNESVRHSHVMIIQTFTNPNDSLMELMLIVDAAKRAGAASVTALLPMFPYARQDRKADAGTPISARVICDMLTSINIDRVITIDLHATQIQGFMSNRVVFDHISSSAFLAYHLRKEYPNMNDVVICSPDAGGVKRARNLGKMMGTDSFCLIDKTRTKANAVEAMQVIGDIDGKNILIVDDMIDTAGTIEKGVDTLYKKGAMDVRVVATHPILSYPALERLEGVITYVTDSQVVPKKRPESIKVFELKAFLKDIIHRAETGDNIGDLFKKWEE